MKIFIDDTTLDVCPRRRVLDIRRLRQHLLDNRDTITEDITAADRVYLFTCGYNKPMEELSMKTIRLYWEKYGDKLVAAGCLPQMNLAGVRRHFPGTIINNQMLRNLEMQPVSSKDIGISRGCMGKCSYCVDKIAVGKLQSRPLPACVSDLRSGLLAGYRSFRIVADDLGAWGQDIGTDFITLLEKLVSIKVTEEPVDFTLKLLEINPFWLIKYKDRLQVFKSSLFKDVLIGVQSANDRILTMMNRNYLIGDVREIIVKLKEYSRRIGIHIISGFPTETGQEFMDSIRFIVSTGIDFGFIFQYSDMEKAPSFHYYPKVIDGENRLKQASVILKQHGYKVSPAGLDKLKFNCP
ncbi:MAG: radical SAM protein [Candidatus Aminicenantes bacterium]|nr:MAG: radical SAM protein [Candidatus Aminicenantes bacterium]